MNKQDKALILSIICAAIWRSHVGWTGASLVAEAIKIVDAIENEVYYNDDEQTSLNLEDK